MHAVGVRSFECLLGSFCLTVYTSYVVLPCILLDLTCAFFPGTSLRLISVFTIGLLGHLRFHLLTVRFHSGWWSVVYWLIDLLFYDSHARELSCFLPWRRSGNNANVFRSRKYPNLVLTDSPEERKWNWTLLENHDVNWVNKNKPPEVAGEREPSEARDPNMWLKALALRFDLV